MGERKEEVVSQQMPEDGGNFRTGPFPRVPSLRNLAPARSQKEDVSPPRKRHGVLTPPVGRSPPEHREDQHTLLSTPPAPLSSVNKHQDQTGAQPRVKTESGPVTSRKVKDAVFENKEQSIT